MTTGLSRIAEKAKADRKVRFTSLAHLLTPEFLLETWKQMNRRGAGGVDGETMQEFERDLEARIDGLHARLRAGQYRPPPVRRVEIPKGDGKTRPLGIPTVEDRLVQRAVARILSAIYEQDFLGCSYGFRPGRKPHQALRALRSHVVAGKVRHVYEADIRGYFNHINHDWLRKMVAHRIADPVILRLIGRWLRAGVMLDGIVVRVHEGSPQGGPISPVLANIYLHYVLDLWFERKFKAWCQGEAYLTRFADDFVVCFQYKRDAERLDRILTKRMGKFGLELAREKTRMLLFGRFARGQMAEYGKKPETFEFLGFKHVCGVDRNGKAAVVRIPSTKSCRKFLDRIHECLRRHMHWRRRDQQRELASRLRGFYQYFALSHTLPKLFWVLGEVKRQWRRAIRRCGQRSRSHWAYLEAKSWFHLPHPKLLHPAV
ncbi:group II intron reverse transcriptase/maturase [Polyangium mundeleinium]|uniref:Group II intron reverse transcriptase/maturase n=1 Tax=Polyangium mundeleinium TaxID=2995306 RepID=A0ABT5F6W2_9BACT|nr:group II intron reverse transcriptase/maturase [Polyangium mundeleinium]MDC0749701.1 group II intron reverse transcriptase/maturase [Polyangium mundeleinium]